MTTGANPRPSKARSGRRSRSYGGFCPQFKYQIGETFGKTTNKILQDSTISSSGRLVLASIGSSKTNEDDTDPKLKLLKARTNSWGDQKLVEKMVPGYTGFIPKSEHYYGNRYAVNCRSAISDFEANHQAHKEKTMKLYLIGALQSGKQVDKSAIKTLPKLKSRHFMPLQTIASEPKTYISKKTLQHSCSPFYMKNENSNKCFMSGYTGFVPRSRPLIGLGYPSITHQALNDFTDNTKKLTESAQKDISIQRQEVEVMNSKPIYPIESGLVPHYTGHIPGQKFRYGETFGHSTQNAMRIKVSC
ncbi:hypothetical protein ScPMuIL_010906 [Solemya velum]